MNAPELKVTSDSKQNIIRVEGALDLYHFEQAQKELAFAVKKLSQATIDLSHVTRLDTSGALALRNIVLEHGNISLSGVKPEYEALFELINETKPGKLPSMELPSPWVQIVERIGEATIDIRDSAIEFITFTGHACVAFLKVIRHPGHLRFNSISRHVEEVGINAIPIISVIAIVMSIILAYQGIAQLRPLGAEQYTINLIAISTLREMGVLLTAIMVAGRSGSAFAAEIGVMKVREEVDALHTLGFDAFELLVIPRIIGVMIALPLLTFIADMMGLLGGAAICMTWMKIPFVQYLDRVHHAITGHAFMVGMLKAPIFAFVIGLVGCMHGLKVSGSSESVGKETTAAVVKSIFLVLILDGFFSIYFQKVGL